jgi:Uma2 family endonuclease
MSVEVTKALSGQTVSQETWIPEVPLDDLIFDDGEPLESNRHRIAMNALIRSLQQAWADRNDFFTGGNMFVYFNQSQLRNQDFRGPDFFAVLNVDGSKQRQGWVVWEEGGRYPDVIVELMSPSTAQKDVGIKKEIYEQVFQTVDYYVFDPFESASLQGWHLEPDQGYQELVTNEQGWLWCETLGFWLGKWEGTIDRERAVWLRFYDATGALVLLPEEVAQQQVDEERQRVTEERQRADEEHLRAEAERQRAEAAQQQADAERQRAEAARQQVDEERQRAEAAQQQADAERQRAERLAERLRAMCINPDDFDS